LVNRKQTTHTRMKTSYPILDPHASGAEARRDGRLCALAMMIKAPRAGESKTRLVPPLTHEEAAALSVAFLRDTAANIASACAESAGDVGRGVDAVAAYTPRGAEAAFDELLPHGFALLPQRGESFGERLFHAAADLLRLGYESCCLIDSDSPTLPRALLKAAIAELSRPGERIVLGPADDGGYYLIGMRRAHPRLFEEIEWSTAGVAAQTIARAREINIDVALLPAWYDVDDAATLRRLCGELFDAPHVGEFDALNNGDGQACDARLTPYTATHTRAALARLLEGEARARIGIEVRGQKVEEAAATSAEGKGGA
jgi:rSAM/selenodomain-associated transferase 1